MEIDAAFKAMRLAADAYIDGIISGDDLHSAVVDYTDARFLAMLDSHLCYGTVDLDGVCDRCEQQIVGDDSDKDRNDQEGDE